VLRLLKHLARCIYAAVYNMESYMNRFQKIFLGASCVLNTFLSQTTNGCKLAAISAIAIASIFTLPTATAANSESVIEEVVVTGTRINGI
jgi:hypothetical protein